MIVIFLVGNEWKGRMFAMAFSESSHAINNITSEDFRLFLQLVCYSWTPLARRNKMLTAVLAHS